MRPEEIAGRVKQREESEPNQLDLARRETGIVGLCRRNVGLSQQTDEILLTQRRQPAILHHLVVKLGSRIRHIGHEGDVMESEP